MPESKNKIKKTILSKRMVCYRHSFQKGRDKVRPLKIVMLKEDPSFAVCCRRYSECTCVPVYETQPDS